jgi:hypothetical protein
MDTRVKPAYDAEYGAARCIISDVFAGLDPAIQCAAKQRKQVGKGGPTVQLIPGAGSVVATDRIRHTSCRNALVGTPSGGARAR